MSTQRQEMLMEIFNCKGVRIPIHGGWLAGEYKISVQAHHVWRRTRLCNAADEVLCSQIYYYIYRRLLGEKRHCHVGWLISSGRSMGEGWEKVKKQYSKRAAKRKVVVSLGSFSWFVMLMALSFLFFVLSYGKAFHPPACTLDQMATDCFVKELMISC